MKNAKAILIVTLIVLNLNAAMAQDRKTCEAIANSVFTAVSEHNFAEIKPHLSDDFTMAEQNQPIAEMVLQQLIAQLKVEQYRLAGVDEKHGLTLNYEVEYAGLGEKQAKFVFNANNKIQTLELSKIKVKTLSKEQQQIEYNPSHFIEIPFSQMGKLIVVKAKLDGIERDFILDSGSPHTLINAAYIAERETTLSGSKGVTGKNLSGMDIKPASIDFYGIKTNKQKHLTLDIAHLEKDDQTIYGLIGYDFIKQYDVLFDYKNKTLTLIKPDYFATYKSQKLSHYQQPNRIPLAFKSHIPIVSTNISAVNYNMGIDCGAEVNLFDEKFYPNIANHLHHITADTLGGAAKEHKTVKSAILDQLTIGNQPYKNTATVFTNIAHLNDTKDKVIDGILGYEILSKQPTLLSYKRNELILFK